MDLKHMIGLFVLVLFDIDSVKGLSGTANEAIAKGRKWLMDQRNADWGWGTRSEAEAILALQLADGGWFDNSDPNVAVSVKQLNLDLLAALSSDSTLDKEEWYGGKLGQYICALVATCQNPQDFYGHDLVAIMEKHMNGFPRHYFNHNFAYAWGVLALCAAGVAVDDRFVQKMANDAGNYTFGIDEAAMSVIALSCVRNQADVTSAMDLGVKYILNKKKNDGSFGNEYTTSLALQAFDAVSHPDLTGLKKNAISVLLKAMGEDGSFQSISAATHVMPVLANKTYADIRVICRKGTSAPMSTTTPGQPISFTITLQSTRLSPGTTRRFTVTTNNGTSLYYAMRELEAGEVGFSFTSRQTSWGVSITSLMGVASSSKERIYWQMLQSPSSPLTTTADKFYPNDGDDIIFRLVTYEGTLVG